MNNMEKNINMVKLLHSISENDVEGVKELEVDMNCTDSDGNTPLHYAVYVKDFQIVEYLLEKKADILIENNANETPFDMEPKDKNIVLLLGTEIINKSIQIINEFELNTPTDKKQNASSEEDDKYLLKKKISYLCKRLQTLKNNNDKLTYEEANLFILFVETVSYHCTSKDKQEKTINYFMSMEEKSINSIKKIRSIILKGSPDSIINLDSMIDFIESCYNGKNKKQKVGFFTELNQYLEYLSKENDDSQGDKKFDFFKMFSNEKKKLVENDTVTNVQHATQLKRFVLNAYKNDIDWEEQWFEFIVNIYPGLKLNEDLIKEANTDYVEKQLLHLRNNLVHGFHEYDIQKFKKAVINLRDLEEIEQSLNTDLKELQNEFNVSREVLSENEARNLVGPKFVKLVFPNKLLNNDDSPVKEHIEEYFKFMSIIEDLNRTSQEKDSMAELDEARTEEHSSRTSQEEDSTKKLDNKARRELFEQFMKLRRIEKDSETYSEEREKLLNKLEDYKVDKFKFDLVCKYYIEKGQGFNKEVSKVVADVVVFIENIVKLVNNFYDFKGVNIILLSELILNKNNGNKELVFSERNNPNSKLKKLIKESIQAMRLVDLAHSFNNIDIPVGSIILKINVKQTIENIIRTLYDTYNEYEIEFDIKEIFSRERFLNELIWQDKKEGAPMKLVTIKNNNSKKCINECLYYKTFGRIYSLIDLEYMSPYIVKLIETGVEGYKANNIINKINLIKLVDNLLNKTEYDKYLNILLSIDFEDFKLYEILYDKILEKKINVKDISSIFEKLTHLDKFIDVLLTKSSSTRNNNDVIELTKSVVEIINQEACSKYESTKYENEKDIVLQILMKGDKIQQEFVGIIEENFLGFIDRDLLIVKIKNLNSNHSEALDILIKLEGRLKSDTINSHKTKYLLILSELVYTESKLDIPNIESTKDACAGLFTEVTKYILCLDDTNAKVDIIQTLKETYNQIKGLEVYKNMLYSSKFLHSDKYLDLLKIAKDVAYWSNNNEEELIYALRIYKEVYSCTKKDHGIYHWKTMLVVKCIAKAYVNLNKFYCQKRDYRNSLYYNLCALNRYNIVYNIEVKIFGPNADCINYTKCRIGWCMFYIIQSYTKSGFLRGSIKKKVTYYKEEMKKDVYERLREMYQVLRKR
ncbi:unnamed protein product [Xylocopa violacea]|uniref:Ankyrin repeat protein n=1 Tax=Xylocopa violacea TaxID=135666 RepID=A0ABP1N5P8_XYLVO